MNPNGVRHGPGGIVTLIVAVPVGFGVVTGVGEGVGLTSSTPPLGGEALLFDALPVVGALVIAGSAGLDAPPPPHAESDAMSATPVMRCLMC